MRSHRIFSSKKRPVHEGNYPLGRLKRTDALPPLAAVSTPKLSFSRPKQPASIVNAMADHQAMMDTIRDGTTNKTRAEIPDSPRERADHIKAFAYFQDASMAGVGPVPKEAWLRKPLVNPEIDRLADEIMTRQTKTLASGIDHIMADLKESVSGENRDVKHHHTALVVLVEHFRDPREGEPGTGWIADSQAHRACLLASENAIVLSNYIRLLGFDAKAHTQTSTDVCLNRMAVAAGLAWADAYAGEAGVSAPFIGGRFGLAVVTTDMELAFDAPLAPREEQPSRVFGGIEWQLGLKSSKAAFNRDPFAKRDYKDSPMPLERLKRVDAPTTMIDEPNIPRVPKRTDMFARSQFGDMGKENQKAATAGYYAIKAAPSAAQRRALGAFVLLQDGDHDEADRPDMTPGEFADHLKATSYFLGIDAVGLSRCPEWTWYSHDARGEAIAPPHEQAVSMVVDQGFETMEGASGDDWISVAQSMRAYLRFSLLGGVVARQIRNLGYGAKAHTVLDGEVLQPPLLLLSGLGEVSRIGEVILHPYLGPRLKAGVVTATMPMAHDKPIDFGLQNFCENCNKCARECPSGAITAGPKTVFNGYEIWKSDSQKCTTYRITTKGGAMCGRCMKTCPWNLEGLFAEAPFRWLASNVPSAAKALARLDDTVKRGTINPLKKWWWDLELGADGAYRPTEHPPNERGISPELEVRHEEQTMAVYPAPLAPHPWPYPYPMDREAGIKAYEDMVSAEEYTRRRDAGDETVLFRYGQDADSPVLAMTVAEREDMTDAISRYVLRPVDGKDLPAWTAGAHIDVVVAPEFLREYSLCSDPADRSKYEIAVLDETGGRGGSHLLHRIFTKGRRIFISPPVNNFELEEKAPHVLLMGGGIGITPMLAFAHRLDAIGKPFGLHYSVSRRADLAFADDLANAPWKGKAHLHVSEEGSRLDAAALFKKADKASHVYICGPDAYMDALRQSAIDAGIDEEQVHIEYFSVPEVPDYVNHPFVVRLAGSSEEIEVGVDETAADALVAKGFPVDIKCSDGLCGVCQCGYTAGEVEHRDFVLSKKQREDRIILCQSRAAEADGVIEIDLTRK